MKKRKDFLDVWSEGLTKDKRQYCMPELIRFSADFPALMMIFMRRLEEILIMGDIGINATIAIIEESERKGERTAY